MRILVSGAKGQLGYDVCRVLDARGIEHRGVDLADCDITDADAVKRCLSGYRPDAVIHCAAWTSVDAAEDPANVPKVRAVNAYGTRNISQVCQTLGCKMLYISTDYVFPGTGDRPWNAVFRIAGKDVAVEHVSTEAYGAKAARPKNSRLSKASLDAGGFARLPGWEPSLVRMLEKRQFT